MARPLLKINYPKTLTREEINSKACKAKAQELQDYLTDEKIEELCVHEAGHLILARRAGVKASPVGPTIYLENGLFKYQSSSVDIPAWVAKDALNYSEKLLEDIGRGLTAGGIFLGHFERLPEARWGDGDDWCQFKQYWHYAAEQDGEFRRRVEPEWEIARDGVRKYLSKLSPSQENDIEQAKAEVKGTFLKIPDLF
jgi:hypothetical protein